MSICKHSSFLLSLIADWQLDLTSLCLAMPFMTSCTMWAECQVRHLMCYLTCQLHVDRVPGEALEFWGNSL